MKKISVVVSIAAASLLVLRAAPVRADESNELTYFTFNAPVELPGVALPAGTYIFEHPISGDEHLVQVLSRDGRTVYGTFLTIPETRLNATDEPTVQFEEAPVTAPPEIKSWFYAGRTTGDEFIYSRQ
ncbi:MAG TPA: hypothetical protein VLV86_15005 [Vicinamibacterales bacterium]|nr:hypothetical protein [Vicinamibacterales bacterium]